MNSLVVYKKEYPSCEREFTYSQSLSFKKENVWQQLRSTTVEEAIDFWLCTIENQSTSKEYQIALRKIIEFKIFNSLINLQQFSMVNSNTIVDRIKLEIPRAEATKQKWAAAFISFTAFLNRRTEGMIKKASPCKEGVNKTFFAIREKVITPPIEERYQWERFFNELKKQDIKYYFIAKIMLQGAKRISEVAALRVSDINFEKGEISFVKKKNRGTESVIVISFRQEFMRELRDFIGDKKGLVFSSRTGKPIKASNISEPFRKAGERIGLPFLMRSHVLRTTAITHLKKNNFSDGDIMKITGHKTYSCLQMYDKSSASQNISKIISLI